MKTTYSIVGMNHRGTESFVKSVQPGTAVTLVREPNNKFDRNAVMVWIDGHHVGYIPKTHNMLLALEIDGAGREWRAPPQTLAQDQAPPAWAVLPKMLALDGRFKPSPNSGYPQVEVET